MYIFLSRALMFIIINNQETNDPISFNFFCSEHEKAFLELIHTLKSKFSKCPA
jgi:hypothetical protein